MKPPETTLGCHVSTRRTMPRRSFLRGTGILLSLPLLESMTSVFAVPVVREEAKPRRMSAICNNLGLLPDLIYPTGRGRDYKPSHYTGLLAGRRNDFTVLNGVSHLYMRCIQSDLFINR